MAWRKESSRSPPQILESLEETNTRCLASLSVCIIIDVILLEVPGTERTVSQESAQDRQPSPVSVSAGDERRGEPLLPLLHLPRHQSDSLHHNQTLGHHQQPQTYQLLEQFGNFPAKVQPESCGRYCPSCDPLNVFSFLDRIKNFRP